jgi:hypothetical protein
MQLSDQNRERIQGEVVESPTKPDMESDASCSESEEEGPVTVDANVNQQKNVVIQIDDEQDEDLLLLMDPLLPEGFNLSNVESSQLMEKQDPHVHSQFLTVVKQFNMGTMTHHPNRQFSQVFKGLYQDLFLQLSFFNLCTIANICYHLKIVQDSNVLVVLHAVAIGQCDRRKVEPMNTSDIDLLKAPSMDLAEECPIENNFVNALVDPSFRLMLLKEMFREEAIATATSTRPSLSLSFPSAFTRMLRKERTEYSQASLDRSSISSIEHDPMVFPLDDPSETNEMINVLDSPATEGSTPNLMTSGTSGIFSNTPVHVEVTSFSRLPHHIIDAYLGRLSMHFVKEATVTFEQGNGLYGMGGFSHRFLIEMQSVARSFASSLGGNAIVSFSIDQCTVEESIKNQGYIFFSISGDVVKVIPKEGINVI